MEPNNVTRLLDAWKIPYTAYQLSAKKRGALEAARLLNVPAEQVFKTIVITRQGGGKPILAVVSGPVEVDLKALANVLGEKKVRLTTEREAEKLTGLKAGGISPLALINRGFQVVVDSSAQSHAEIYISGGRRGLYICMPVKALVSLTNAKMANVSR